MQAADIFVGSPYGIHDVPFVIAAGRAGARGLLWATIEDDLSSLLQRCDEVERHCRNAYGIQFECGAEHLAAAVLDARPQLRFAVFESATVDLLCPLSKGNCHLFLRVSQCHDLSDLPHAYLAGVILKGSEAGGTTSETTSFLLLQHWRRRDPTTKLDVWVHGGVGPHTAAAAKTAGARGVMLDSQLLLCRESPLADNDRQFVRAMDGGETVHVGSKLGRAFRLCSAPGSSAQEWFDQEQQLLANETFDDQDRRVAWDTLVRESDPNWALKYVGQDVAFAPSLADRYVTVAGVVQAIIAQVAKQITASPRQGLLTQGSAFAAGHRIRYPILQGPMTRVSDTASFAHRVAEAGGLPFLALALNRGTQVSALLKETSALLRGAPWGVGLLGFLPPEIRQEQVEAILEYAPPYALIAGGRPDQALQLEERGIPTYLHVPSPGLLRMFLRQGARRFVFEGRECGGHVGPRTSFVLWQTMIDILLEHAGSKQLDDVDVVFAGGIHDDLSAAMTAAMAGELAQRGIRVGFLMGTAYLFTEEAVESGAIVPGFQRQALMAQQTVLFESGPGHAIRCVETPYYKEFESFRSSLAAKGESHAETVTQLERRNVGRLRVASKGLDRVAGAPGAPRKLAEVSLDSQHQRGMYMMGQVATLRDDVVTIDQLHQTVCQGGHDLLRQLTNENSSDAAIPQASRPCDVAIVGLACFYPGAGGLQQYWENILNKKYAVTEVPGGHWDWRPHYDADPRAKDKSVSKWGGFLGDVEFDPLQYGITPKSMLSIEPLQLLLLEAVSHAIRDAGYEQRPFDRERTSAILGIGGGGSPLALLYGFRACLPMLDTTPDLPAYSPEILSLCDHLLPEWTEDSFPGFLMSVAVGRVANRFDFGGSNYAVDAACASSLAAVHASLRELESGTADVAFAMGADTVNSPYAYVSFSKTHALSPRGRCRPFDEGADGIVLSEGIGVTILKRLADAERDGDRIYAVIRGAGSSSDGKDKGLTAPNAVGQRRALQRAYEKAGISPSHVGLFEAHGTGTVVGDRTEAESLATMLSEHGAGLQSCALGSVKSMIGHTKCAAGIGGLIKTTMALHHKVLPPTLVERPNEFVNFPETPLYLNADARPWVQGSDQPRRAGVSAFGFGGTNVHVVMEEYRGDYVDGDDRALRTWPSELFSWRGDDRAQLSQQLAEFRSSVLKDHGRRLVDMAAGAHRAFQRNSGEHRLALVADSIEHLGEQLDRAVSALEKSPNSFADPRGIYYGSNSTPAPQLAMLFPGQGAQYPNMLADVAISFPQVRQAFDAMAHESEQHLGRGLGHFIYPPSTFSEARSERVTLELGRTDVAQPALGAAGIGLFRLLKSMGVQPDCVAGHSYGEYVALWAARSFSEASLIRLSYARGAALREATADSPGGMIAVQADERTVSNLASSVAGLTLANYNGPDQHVVSGNLDTLNVVEQRLESAGLSFKRLQAACAFHSPEVAAASARLGAVIDDCEMRSCNLPVYSNVTGRLYDDGPEAARVTLRQHLTSPVRFQSQIESMYTAGVRLFLEVGPQAHLTSLVRRILGDREHDAIAVDSKGANGVTQLQKALGQLIACNVEVQLGELFQGRTTSPQQSQTVNRRSGTKWVVNGVRSKPKDAPEPKLLGQAPEFHGEESRHIFAAAAAGSASLREKQTTQAAETTPNDNTKEQPASMADSAHEKLHSNNSEPNNSGRAIPNSPQSRIADISTGPRNAVPGTDPVMLGFQELMAKFLETQQAVMLQYLDSGHPHAGVAPSLPIPPQKPLPSDSPKPGAGGVAAGQASSILAERGRGETADSKGATEPTPSAVQAEDASAESTERLSIEKIGERLVQLVSERTGYPEEMLEPDLDLEGDLGIDSIKRVEILGELAEGLEGLANQEDALELEKLTGKRTLRGMLGYLEEALFSAPANRDPVALASVSAADEEAKPASSLPVDTPTDLLQIQRGLVRVVESPLPAAGKPMIPGGTVLVVDDQQGIAVELAEQLSDFGIAVVVVRHAANRQQVAEVDGVWLADLTSEAQVKQTVVAVQEVSGKVGGLVHLAARTESESPPPEMKASADVRSFYLLCRALESDLNEIGQSGGAFVFAVTGIDGALGYDPQADANPAAAGHGGLMGFAKCAAMEWPNVLVRAIDFSSKLPPADAARYLIAELSDQEGPLEVGHDGKRRVTWEPFACPLEESDEIELEIDEHSVILLTGGARGITASIAERIAVQTHATLILVGRSPLPNDVEDAATAELEKASELKSAIILRRQERGDGVAPADVEREYQRLMCDREIRKTLQATRAAGSKVEYHSLDMRDERAVRSLLNHITAHHGSLTGVIHGAGVIEDKLIRDKSPESFERVFQTKVHSAYHLARYLDPRTLKFCLFFASIASRFGNRGQSDYAAANEVLSKLAAQLDKQWPARVASIAWGPWAEIGMVSYLEKHLTARGVSLIPPEEGSAHLVNEILRGRKGDTEVLIAGGAERLITQTRAQPSELTGL